MSTTDLTPRWDNFALYLPSIQSTFCNTLKQSIPNSRNFPSGLSMKDLNFWSGKSKLWTYSKILYSVGQFKVGDTPADAVTSRINKKDFTILGDSGGFQIGKGAFKGIKGLENKAMPPEKAAKAWRESNAKDWIVRWLNSHADYSMTIDMPLWAQLPENKDTPFHNCSKELLIQMSLENLKFIERSGLRKTKWLNVIQGSDRNAMLEWWNAVKWFRHGGWAIAGDTSWRGGIAEVMHTLLTMRDDDAFEVGQDWLHVLGVSQAKWAVLLSAIQRGLRVKNPNLTVSYDSASAFQASGVREQVAVYPKFSSNLSNSGSSDSWVLTMRDCPQSINYTDKDDQRHFPFQSPLGDRLMLNQLNVRADRYGKKQFDSLSNAILTNHNVWVYVRAFLEANELAVMERHNAEQFVPKILLDGCDLIEELLNKKAWARTFNKHQDLFAAIDKL